MPAGSRGVLFLPYLTGGNGDEKDASGCFLNMTMDDDQFVMWRAVLEAIGYDYIGLADNYRKAGVDLTRITVTEGGSRDDLWNQIKSDMLEANIVRFKNPGGAVLTNCIFGAWATGGLGGETDDPAPLREALAAAITPSGAFEPDASRSRIYRELYEMRRSLVAVDMKAAFEKLVRMRDVH